MEENKETVENVNVEETENVETQTTNQNEVQAEKTFTQEDVDRIIKDRLKRMPSKEELKAFKDWQESQKTAEQKQAEKEAEYAQKDTTISQLQKENAILKAGVKEADDIDYVLFKVSKMEGEFEENLAKFLKDNPKFLGQELEERKATGAPVRTLSSTQNDGVLSILANKHKDINF